MKKIQYFIYFLAVTLTFTACDSLDLAPEDYYGSKNFWNNEFNRMDPKFQNEAVSPILNKVGQFISSTKIRNTVANSSLSTRRDSGFSKIVNWLAKGNCKKI